MNRRFALLLSCVSLTLSSCSVVMASNKSGTDLESLQNATSRMQLIALGAEPTSTDKSDAGELVETYRLQKERGSIARAFMHGMLDLSTAFLWELAGTPIEFSLDQQKFYSVKVTFDESEHIKKIELN